MRKAVVLLVGSVVLLGFVAGALGQNYDPETFVYVTIAGWDSFDPAWAYDTASGEALFHIYDTLVTYDLVTTDIVPMLATKVPSVDNGLLVVNADKSAVIRFPIRQGVRFHDGSIMTAEDVVYSLRRAMLADPTAGPNWMILYALLGVYELNEIIDSEGPDAAYDAVMNAVYVDPSDPNVVVMESVALPPFFFQILAGSWCSIISKEFTIAHGGWDGKQENWLSWHDRAKEQMALYRIANGTGPFKLVGVPDPQLGFSVERFDDYWGVRPSLRRVDVVYDNNWTNRRLMLANGDADAAYIPVQYKGQMEGTPGVRTVYRLPSLANGGMLPNMDVVVQGNDRLGSGQLDGNGIPPEFFQDVHVRRAFAYLFPYETYVSSVLMGESITPATSIPSALPYAVTERRYFYDPQQAIAELKLAWNGQLWEKGFFMRLDYNVGNDARKTACEMLRDEFMKIDPRFRIEVRGIPWPQYLDDNRARRMTMFYIGWLPDYPDADNYAFPYYHSKGTFGGRGSFAVLPVSATIDRLIEQAATELDPTIRADLYRQIQELAQDNALNLMLDEGTARRWMRTWVQDFTYNPTLSPAFNWRVLSKTPTGSPAAGSGLHPAMATVTHKVEEW